LISVIYDYLLFLTEFPLKFPIKKSRRQGILCKGSFGTGAYKLKKCKVPRKKIKCVKAPPKIEVWP
jgi:hypothetical protein